MESPHLTSPQISAGTVAAAECCFGAELYDYLLLGSAPPICMNYLLSGAGAFIGSTNIAYGPAAANGQADLITQYFLELVLSGASTGRAMLQARQRFVQTQTMSNPFNLKTLAQFVLYGDPSCHAVAIASPVDKPAAGDPAPAQPKATPIDLENQRKVRRSELFSEGKAVASYATLPGKRIRSSSPAVRRFAELALSHGISAKPSVFSVTGGAQFQLTAKQFDSERQVMVAIEKKEPAPEASLPPSYRVMIGHVQGDGLFSVEEFESR